MKHLLRNLFLIPLMVVALFGVNFSVASAVPSTSTNHLPSYASHDGRAIKESENDSLQLQILPGDKISISNADGLATWTSKTGEVVATIQLQGTGNSKVNFSYNPLTKTIEPAASSVSKGASASACIPKWVGWAWGVTWGALVCLPLGAGVSGVATPIVGVITGQACAAAGGALVTAKSC